LVLEPARVPLAGICREAIDEAELAHPGHPIEFQPWDEAQGDWDRDRLLDLIRRLISDALSRGPAGEPIIVSVIDCDEEALLAVANRGTWSSGRFGLEVVKEIVLAQGGRIDLTSDESATLFHVWLPKGERS
jgi:signal transduction histidine kinase